MGFFSRAKEKITMFQEERKEKAEARLGEATEKLEAKAVRAKQDIELLRRQKAAQKTIAEREVLKRKVSGPGFGESLGVLAGQVERGAKPIGKRIEQRIARPGKNPLFSADSGGPSFFDFAEGKKSVKPGKQGKQLFVKKGKRFVPVKRKAPKDDVVKEEPDVFSRMEDLLK